MMATTKVKLSNYARPDPQPGAENYYRWKVFVDAPDAVLNEIQSVEYTLHPTFPEPVRTSQDRGDRFGLEASGWGEFTILAKVRLKDGTDQTVPYWLDLHRGWPEGK
jgi:transcription initiation factor IIF auxiliary subunit